MFYLEQYEGFHYLSVNLTCKHGYVFGKKTAQYYTKFELPPSNFLTSRENGKVTVFKLIF